MSARLDQIKLNLIRSTYQVTLFNLSGKVTESCETLLKVGRQHSIYDQFDFLKSLEDIIPELPLHEKLVFAAVEWEERVHGLFSISIERIEASLVQWIIQDNSGLKEDTLKLQQERNNATINEEFLEIQQKYLEMEKELLRYKNDELQRVQEFKTLFFAEVSHEMRTPLNSISGLISLLQEGLSARNPEYLGALRATSNHLNSIINDVLDLSKAEAGKLILDDTTFSAQQVVQNIITGFSLLAKEKRLVIDFTVAKEVPNTLIGDPIRLSQIIYNLLGNALKFTDEGSVSFTVKSEPKDAETHQLHFEIKDTGKGMSGENIATILEPYAQSQGQSHHQFGGTGLGMGIANQLITLMGGELSIESRLGKGTTMAFDLNFKEGEAIHGEAQTAPTDLSHLNVLVAEDDPISLILLENTLTRSGAKSQFVSNMGTLKEALLNHSFDLILADINLEDGPSTNVLIELKQKLQTPVIFLSGESESKLPELKQLENWSFLMKPIDSAELVALMTGVEKPLRIDLSNLKAVTQNDLGLMKELMGIISETLPLELEKLEEAIKGHDFKMAEKVLHKINPSISYFGIPTLVNERKVLYDAVAVGEDISTRYPEFSRQVLLAIEQLEKETEKL